jgi:hypothetical protein
MAKKKGQIMIYKTLHRALNIEHYETHSGEFSCSGSVRRFCFISGTRRFTLGTTPMISHELGKGTDCNYDKRNIYM